MYKLQCLVALVCVLAAAAGDAGDCAGNNPTLPRAAERFKTRLAAATAGCQVVVYTTLFYPPGVRLPHPSTRLGPAAHPSSAREPQGECYIIVAGAASAASLREHCDVSPWRIVEMRKTHPWRWAIDLPKSGWGLHSESFVRTALEDARVRPVFSASPCGHRVRVRGTESVTDCNATEAEPGRHQCLPLRDLKFPPGV